MPSYNIPLTRITRQEAARYAGLRGQDDLLQPLLSEACTEALLLAKPRACWQIYPYSAGLINAPQPLPLSGASIVEHLSGATAVAVLAVTIGAGAEEKSAAHFDGGNYTAGLLLDAAASAAVEDAADIANELITAQARVHGLAAISRFSPGYGDWGIASQPEILALAGGETIGISVTPSCMLLPRKSITAVIGLCPPGIITATPCKNHCANCQKTDCLARKEF